MDPKALGQFLMQPSTADVLNTPVRRGGILPVTEYPNRTEFDLSSGLTGALMDAFTAPARAARGEISEADMIPEAFNFAGSLTLGNLLSGAAAPVKARAMSAYKAMGPEDAPADALKIERFAGRDRFIVGPDDARYLDSFANHRTRPGYGDELLATLQGRGMGPANSNSATAELFANAKTGAAVPLATRALEAQQPQGIRAFHGSPHDFDRFSMDAIGSGEGAQAYGHGLYFADAEDVAKSYRDKLGAQKAWSSDDIRNAEPMLADRLVQMGYPEEVASSVAQTARLEHTMNTSKDQLTNLYGNRDATFQSALRDAWAMRNEVFGGPTGHMYEVRINADPNDFLDWYAPTTGATMERVAPLGVQEGAKGFDALQQIAAQLAKDGKLQPGKDLGVQVSEALRDAGIPGIRYLDQMSRGAGEGSSNYVVFDDALIEILRKYGLLGPVAGGGTLAGMLMGGQEGETY